MRKGGIKAKSDKREGREESGRAKKSQRKIERGQGQKIGEKVQEQRAIVK